MSIFGNPDGESWFNWKFFLALGILALVLIGVAAMRMIPMLNWAKGGFQMEAGPEDVKMVQGLVDDFSQGLVVQEISFLAVGRAQYIGIAEANGQGAGVAGLQQSTAPDGSAQLQVMQKKGRIQPPATLVLRQRADGRYDFAYLGQGPKWGEEDFKPFQEAWSSGGQ